MTSVDQQRRLVTPIPGPRSSELHARKTAAVSAGVGVGLPAYVERAGGGILVDVDGNHLIDFGSGIAVTTVFVFLNAWNEFLFAVVLGGNKVRPVTVAMFNFISVEQTQWARLAAGAMVAMAPVILVGLFAQRHIVKGLTVGAVKGGGRR